MKLKHLKDLSHTLPEMIIADRVPGCDAELLATVPDGTIEVDLLKVKVEHSAAGNLHLTGVEQIAEWMRERLESLSIPIEQLREARLSVTVKTDKELTNLDMFRLIDVQAKGFLATENDTYTGKAKRPRTWRFRKVDGKWEHAFD